jgi:hypothetical protein
MQRQLPLVDAGGAKVPRLDGDRDDLGRSRRSGLIVLVGDAAVPRQPQVGLELPLEREQQAEGLRRVAVLTEADPLRLLLAL